MTRSSLVWCWMMKSMSSWWGGLLSGTYAESSLWSCGFPLYVIRSRKSVTTPSSRDMGDLLSPGRGGGMGGAASLLLAFTACAGEEPAQSIPGLIAVSGKAPWNSSCTGPAGSGDIFLNSELEPSVAVDPTDPMRLTGAWQQ